MSDRGALEICYEMSDDFLDLARKRFQAKYYGWSLLGLAVLGPPFLLFLWFGPMGRIFAGITTGALGMLGIIFATIQIMAKQNRRVFREKYQIRSVVFRMTEEGVGFKAAWGSAQLP